MDNEVKELIVMMTKLIEQSEKRVDRCNDMIGKTHVILDKITSEYTRQLSEIQKARDSLVEQNGELIKIVKNTESQLDSAMKRYDLLLEKVFGMVNTNKSENNINVK